MRHRNNTPQLVLVENSPDDEMMTLRAIAKSGVPCQVLVRRSGEEALEHLLDEQVPLPAVVVLDYSLPKQSGLDVLKEMRRQDRTRSVPVVMFSGEQLRERPLSCYQCGANSWVAKPSDPNEYTDRLMHLARYWLTVNFVC